MAHDVFISYSHKDRNVANAACATLEQHGLRCWIAPRDIVPGEEWGDSIIRGIQGSRAMVLVLTGHSNASAQVRREVERAVSHGLILVPFRAENIAPSGSMEYFLATAHWLDAFTPPLEKHLVFLAEVLQHALSGAPESQAPTPPPPGLRWRYLHHAVLVAGAAALLLGGVAFWQMRYVPWAEAAGPVATSPAELATKRAKFRAAAAKCHRTYEIMAERIKAYGVIHDIPVDTLDDDDLAWAAVHLNSADAHLTDDYTLADEARMRQYAPYVKASITLNANESTIRGLSSDPRLAGKPAVSQMQQSQKPANDAARAELERIGPQYLQALRQECDATARISDAFAALR